MNSPTLVAVPPALQKHWPTANQRLVAKAIGELVFEEVLLPIDDGNGEFRLAATETVHYRFRAARGIWTQLRVDPESLRRNGEPVRDAAQFFIDINHALNMTPATLSQFLQELANTLLADVTLLARSETRLASDWLQLSPTHLQRELDGHPKALANKGRLGWGAAAFEQYGTETTTPFQLAWLAAHKAEVQSAFAAAYAPEQLLDESLSVAERQALERQFAATGLPRQDYLVFPVHPWQWQHWILSQYAGELAAQRLLWLGVFGDRYQPLQSLRTLANVDRPECMQVKLPLGVLNTSCYRGIPGKYITVAPLLSTWLQQRCLADPVLQTTNVLAEPAGLHYPHPHHRQIAEAPYRYQELLGAIWRESPIRIVPADEWPIMLGALWQRDSQGKSLVMQLIEQSGLSVPQWLSALFTIVVVPLYHLLCRYGVGIVAHGQNLTVSFRAGVPVRLILKDLQGDVRLIDSDWPEQESLPASVRQTLTRLPAHYLIHDLQTGHFVTVLRFLSDCLHSELGYTELEFYGVLARVLRHYQRDHANARFAQFDLFAATQQRLCINRVRFRLGYGDDAERPLPELGSPLANPLYLAESAARLPVEELPA